MKAISILSSLLAVVSLSATSSNAFDLSFGTKTCSLVQVTFTLTPYEYEYGSSISVWAGGADQDIEIANVQITPYFSSSSLSHTFTFDPALFSTSGTYTFGFGVYGSNKYILNYNGQANDPDYATRQLTLSCGSGGSGASSTITTTTPYPKSTTTSTRSSQTSSTTFTYPVPCGGGAVATATASLAGRDVNVLERRCTPPPKHNDAAVIGGAVGGSLGGLALIGMVVFFALRRRKRQREQSWDNQVPVFSPSIDVVQSGADPEKGSLSDVQDATQDNHNATNASPEQHHFDQWSRS